VLAVNFRRWKALQTSASRLTSRRDADGLSFNPPATARSNLSRIFLEFFPPRVAQRGPEWEEPLPCTRTRQV
jgi:hypothetical protein